jgi:hypothetical protein
MAFDVSFKGSINLQIRAGKLIQSASYQEISRRLKKRFERHSTTRRKVPQEKFTDGLSNEIKSIGARVVVT